MASATITVGNGLFLQGNTMYNTASSGDWTHYIGHWNDDYWNTEEYGEGGVLYTFPAIEDRLYDRTITIPCKLYHNYGQSKIKAVFSSQTPSTETRFGPTTGVVSETIEFSVPYDDGRPVSMTLTIKLLDGVAVSGKSLYLHLYQDNNGVGTNFRVDSVVTSSFSNATMTYSAPYTLTVDAGTGSTITVNRTSSGTGSTGTLSNNANLYYGDILKVSFSANSNYKLLTGTLNGSAFTSGNTHTVSANVTVKTTAQVLASSVGATAADIGSVSTITVTKYNTTYYHSLKYSFGDISGWIKSDGSISATEVKYRQTSIAFEVPVSFYAQIPNAKYGTCTITCYTYSTASSTTVLGDAKNCTFRATANQNACKPAVSATVVDTNTITVALTGDSSKLIRYKSTAKCILQATTKASSTISALSIAGSAVTGTTENGVTTATKSFSGVEKTSFAFSAKDSRAYTTSVTKVPTMVAYIKLTCNPEVYRPSPTGSSMMLKVSGNYYRGSFGAYSNTLTLSYRFREASSASYGSWITIPSTSYTIGTNAYTSAAISLGDDFDYKKSYVFQVRATDGAGGYTLSTSTKTVDVKRGIPVFDWGEADFEFHVPVKISDGSLQIGATVLTEAQLQNLLALLS